MLWTPPARHMSAMKLALLKAQRRMDTDTSLAPHNCALMPPDLLLDASERPGGERDAFHCRGGGSLFHIGSICRDQSSKSPRKWSTDRLVFDPNQAMREACSRSLLRIATFRTRDPLQRTEVLGKDFYSRNAGNLRSESIRSLRPLFADRLQCGPD